MLIRNATNRVSQAACYSLKAQTSRICSRQLSNSTKPPDFYALFPSTLPKGPPPQGAFDINTRDLRREFLRHQQSAHPDVADFKKSSPEGPSSAYINKAYETLKDPLARSEYLLSRRGIEVEEDAKSDDKELLMEVLEVREEMEGAKHEDDLHALRAANQARIEKCLRMLDEAFERDDLMAARAGVVRLRYWWNTEQALKYWEAGNLSGVT